MPKAFAPQDHYFHLAKKQGLRARSAFKLAEILEKFPQLLRRGAHLIDCGAAPGSFLQILAQKVGPGGKILGIDLQEIVPFPEFQTQLTLLQADVFAPETLEKIRHVFPERVDLITSDLAPATSGIVDVDQWKSIELCQRVLEFGEKFLKFGGNMILKIFVGADFQEFWKQEFQPHFKKSRTYKPQASRDRSFETYLIGEGFQKNSSIS